MCVCVNYLCLRAPVGRYVLVLIGKITTGFFNLGRQPV